MFVESMPLLTGRTVLITVAKVDDRTVRVNVIPHLKADDNPALSTPLTCAGPPEELDADLGKHQASYVQTHRQTASTLAEAKAIMEVAAKAAQEEAKRKKGAMKSPMTTVVEPAFPTPGATAPSSAPMERLGSCRPAPTQSQRGLAL